jgi:hypothetical protein
LKTLLLMLVFGLTACMAPVSTPCNGYPRSKIPIRMKLSDSVDSMHLKAIQIAMDEINRQTGMTVFELIESPRVSNLLLPVADLDSAIYVLDTWEPVRSLEQGRTSMYFMGGISYEADIRINAKDYKFYVGSSPPIGVNLESLYLHELSHAAGLMHSNELASVMFPYMGESTKRLTMTPADLETYRCFYARKIKSTF